MFAAIFIFSASSAWAFPHLTFSASFSAGHDDQVLAEPERRGLIEAVAEDFGVATGRLSLRSRGFGNSDRFSLVGELSGTRYNSSSLGEDTGAKLLGSYRARLSDRVVFDGNAAWWQFRREALSDFNVNMNRLGARVAWAPSSPWLVSVATRQNWIEFPDRVFEPDTSGVGGDGEVTVNPIGLQSEQDSQFDLAFSVLRRLGASAYVMTELSHRWSNSNEEPFDFSGPVAQLRAGNRIATNTSFSAYVAYSKRNFDLPYVIDGAQSQLVLGDRDDKTWQFGFSVERSLNQRMKVFADGSWLDQTSSIETFEFDHARFSMGVSMDLWSVGEVRNRSMDTARPVRPTLAPVSVGKGIRFRLDAPAARVVSIVGDFNGWNPSRGEMRRRDTGGWETIISLSPGIWRYAFVVDGTWVRPPDAPRYESDGFGGENGILEIFQDEAGVPGVVTEGRWQRPIEQAKAQEPSVGGQDRIDGP